MQMEEAKSDVEKKVATLLKYIQNKKKIPKVIKKELLYIVNDLHHYCNFLCSVALSQHGTSSPPAASPSSSPASDSDLEYFSSEETELSDLSDVLRKLQDSELRNEDFGRQVSKLKQETEFLRDQNMELAIDIEGKRKEDREHLKDLMTIGEAALLCNQKKELELELERKTNDVKRLEEETEKRAKTKVKLAQEKEDMWKKVQKLEANIDALEARREELSEELKSKSTENQMLHERIQEIKDQDKLVKEQRETIDKMLEDQKVMMKRWSFGSKPINTDLLERKVEEVAGDFQMKVEDHLRILYRRIHVAEQIHLESKKDYVKNRENRGDDDSVSETTFKKLKEMVEEGLAGLEKAMKKLEEGEAMVERVKRVSKEIDSARKWVREKKSETKHEVETLEAKLECGEAQAGILKEKLTKLEKKLAEEGTGKLSLENAMRRIKKLEIGVKERDVEIKCLGEEKREAIRQLCVLMDYQRCRYDDLKTSLFNVALHA